VAVLGLLMMSSAAGRKRRLRRERRELAAENRDLSVRADRAERVARGEVPAGRGRRVGRRRRQEQEREAEAAAASGAFTSDSMRHQRAVGPDWTAGQPAAGEQATTAYPQQDQAAYPPSDQPGYSQQQQNYPGHPQLGENTPGSYPAGSSQENPEGYRS
jgi:hypothetical protein